MSRKPLNRTSEFPYHVTARSNNREPFPFDLGLFWRILCDEAFVITMLFEARVHCLVLMPNHFHMLISTPSHDLGIVMQEFMRSITRTINLKTGRSGRVFGGAYHWTLVDSSSYFAHAYKYVYRNPVRGGLFKRVEEYPYSTIETLLSDKPRPFPLWYPFNADEFILIPNDLSERHAWLNTPFQIEHEEQIQKSLKKTTFRPPRQGWRKTFSELAQPQLR